ncbi:MobA/MobL protein domain-containing protein [Sphingomonas antarctica]|uniref:MobA/MobL family protein n=1 Tax=Sphingomonas antarctica TaxID=2040274 RepID=UPI0039E86BD2
MTPQITKADVDAAKRILSKRPSGGPGDNPDFAVRPISEAWRLGGRRAAYKTAVANVAYIWRDATGSDRFGPMPQKFAERRCELHGSGLILPPRAPLWAGGYTVWEEADAAADATGDFTAIAAWHVMAEIPTEVPPQRWHALVTNFVERELAAKGLVSAWAIHALEGDDGAWIVRPHSHLIVTARQWRHDCRHGLRHPAGIGSWGAQARLERAWYRACDAAGLLTRHFASGASRSSLQGNGW